jgi:hypothetical protein
MEKYEIINDNFADLCSLQIGVHVTKNEIINALQDYAKNHNGIINNLFVFDRYLWNAIDLNHQIVLSLNTIWRYVEKYTEEIPQQQ